MHKQLPQGAASSLPGWSDFVDWLSHNKPAAQIFVHWLANQGLSIILTILGAVILGRVVAAAGNRITARIDAKSKSNDALVRSEQSKYRHALAQVITYVVVGIIGVIATTMILKDLGVVLTSLVAPATVLGAALGFGAQRVVQDFLAGFFIVTERQYGYGDVVSIVAVGAISPADGTVEDVTLRVTRLRNADGEFVTIPNGQIVKVINKSRDWARAVVDIPVPPYADIGQVISLLRKVGDDAFEDPNLQPLLLDVPTVMGVEGFDVQHTNVRIVARTLPGKQFVVSRKIRGDALSALQAAGYGGARTDPTPELARAVAEGAAAAASKATQEAWESLSNGRASVPSGFRPGIRQNAHEARSGAGRSPEGNKEEEPTAGTQAGTQAEGYSRDKREAGGV